MAAPKFHPTPLPTVDEPTLTHTWPCVCNMQKAMWTQGGHADTVLALASQAEVCTIPGTATGNSSV